MKGNKILGREVALWSAFIAAAIQVFSAIFLPLSTEQQGVLNAFAAVVLGVVAAMAVSLEKAVPLAVGLIQAAIAVAIAFGYEISPEQVSAVTAFVAGASAFFIRTQVVAPVGAEGAAAVKQL